jgi:mannose-6-phosphate isomerase
MFLPSGRVHAIGSGLVIFEIQQNSDTTYRVFDWNRVGLDGQPRDLHVAQSLASIDFNDFEPSLVQSEFRDSSVFKSRPIIANPLFMVLEFQAQTAEFSMRPSRKPMIIALVKGAVTLTDGGSNTSVDLKPGQFCLLPACLKNIEVKTQPQTTFLCVEAN